MQVREVEEAMVAAAAPLRATAMSPVDPESATATQLRVKFKVNPTFDLASELARHADYQSWVRRLRDAAMDWGRQERAQGAAADPDAPPLPKPPPGTTPGALVASFTSNAATLDELPMRLKLTISVEPPSGREVLNMVGGR